MFSTTLDHDALRLYTALADGGIAIARSTTGYLLLAMKSEALARALALKGEGSKGEYEPTLVMGTIPVLEDVAAWVGPVTRGRLARAARAQRPLTAITRANATSRLLAGIEPSVVNHCTREARLHVALGVGDLVARTVQIASDQGRLVVGAGASPFGRAASPSLDSVPAPMRHAAAIAIDHGPVPLRARGSFGSELVNLAVTALERPSDGPPAASSPWDPGTAYTEREADRAA